MSSVRSISKSISRSGVVRAPYEQAIFDQLHQAIAFYQFAPDALIQILHRAQELFGYLREDVVRDIAQQLRIPLSRVHGVIGFYSFFSRTPQGKHTISLCMGTGCYVRGSEHLLRNFQKELGIKPGETTSDGRFSLRCVRCLGACGVAPAVMIGNDLHSKVKVGEIKRILKAYK